MDRGNLKRIFQKEIERHYLKSELYKKTQDKFKSHKAKRIKHMHKKHQTIKLAEELGLEYCKCCGGLRLR